MLVLSLEVGKSIRIGEYEIFGVLKSRKGMRIGFKNVPRNVLIVRSDAIKKQHEGPLEADGGPPGAPAPAPSERANDWHHEEGTAPDISVLGITPRKPR